LPGETVQVRNGHVLVNGIVLRERYASGPTVGNTSLVRVPMDAVFVMGDNRSPGGSLDSRRLGPIPLNKLIGRARLAFWPPSDWSILDGRAAR
jgi:signal peptidase I